jgi:hypothetical protein
LLGKRAEHDIEGKVMASDEHQIGYFSCRPK